MLSATPESFVVVVGGDVSPAVCVTLSCLADMVQLHQGSVVLTMPSSSVQCKKMDLNALKEQLQKLVPGAHLTLAHHHPEVGHTPAPSPLQRVCASHTRPAAPHRR